MEFKVDRESRMYWCLEDGKIIARGDWNEGWICHNVLENRRLKKKYTLHYTGDTITQYNEQEYANYKKHGKSILYLYYRKSGNVRKVVKELVNGEQTGRTSSWASSEDLAYAEKMKRLLFIFVRAVA